MNEVRYQVLEGGPDRLAAMIPAGSYASIPSSMDHLLVREAERAKGIANPTKAETEDI
jgi:hypothetical protein